MLNYMMIGLGHYLQKMNEKLGKEKMPNYEEEQTQTNASDEIDLTSYLLM